LQLHASTLQLPWFYMAIALQLQPSAIGAQRLVPAAAAAAAAAATAALLQCCCNIHLSGSNPPSLTLPQPPVQLPLAIQLPTQLTGGHGVLLMQAIAFLKGIHS
jgi:hypothetical protein